MSVEISQVSNSQSFGVLVQRVNDVAETLSSNVVTTGALTGGAVTYGNAFISGILGSNLIYASQISGGNISTNSALVIVSNTYVNNYLSIGNTSVNAAFGYVAETQAIGSFNASVNSFIETTTTNDNTGPNASADFVAYNDLHDQTVFLDMGINSTNWANDDWTINGPSDSYLYNKGGDLSIGTGDENYISFFTNGTFIENQRLKITSGGNVGINNTAPDARLTVTGTANVSANVRIGGVTTIANSISVVTVDSNLIPKTNNLYNLGNSTNRWASLYVSGSTIYLGTVTLTDSGGNLRMPGGIVDGTLTVNSSITGSNSIAITGNATFSNTIAVTGNAVFSNTIAVTGNAVFSNSIAITGNATLSNTIFVTGNATFSNSIAATGNATFSNSIAVTGNATFSNSIAVTGNATFSNTIAVTGNVTFSNQMSITGNVVLSNTIAVTGNATFSNLVTISGDVSVVNSNISITTNSAIGFNVGNSTINTTANTSSFRTGNSTNFAFVNSSYISLSNSTSAFAFVNTSTLSVTNIAGLITTASQPLVAANSAVYLGGNTAADLKAYADAAYANAITNAGRDASGLTTGTLPTGRLTGSYTGITAVGTLSTLTVGNSTSIATISTNNITTTGNVSVGGNSSVTGNLTVTGNTSITGNLVVSGVSTNSVIAGDLTVQGNFNVIGTTSSGSTATGDIIPSSNSINLGRTDRRFTLWGMSANFANPVTVTNSVSFGNTMPSANAVLLGNSTLRWELSSNSILANNIAVSNTLGVAANSTFSGNVYITGLASFTSNTTAANNIFTANSTFSGNATFNSNATFSANIAVSNVTINSVSQLYSTKYLVQANTTLVHTADSFAAGVYRSAEYILQMTSGVFYQSSKLLVIHDGINALVTEYAQLATANSLGTFGTDINASNVRLRITPASPYSITANSTGVNSTANSISLTSASTYFALNDRIYYTVPTGNSAVGGLTGNSSYFISFVNSTALALSLTSGGANIDLTEVRTGAGETHYLRGDVTVALTRTSLVV
jgi:hypothetical protein